MDKFNARFIAKAWDAADSISLRLLQINTQLSKTLQREFEQIASEKLEDIKQRF